MDIFHEYIVKREKGGKDILLDILIVLAGLVVAAAGLFLFRAMFFPIALFLACWGVYMLITNRNLEFEYILTNSSLDIDKIIAKRRRRRMITVELRNIEAFGKVGDDAYQRYVREKIMVLDMSSNRSSVEKYYMLVPRPARRYVVVIEPNDKMLEAIKKFMPRHMLG